MKNEDFKNLVSTVRALGGYSDQSYDRHKYAVYMSDCLLNILKQIGEQKLEDDVYGLSASAEYHFQTPFIDNVGSAQDDEPITIDEVSVILENNGEPITFGGYSEELQLLHDRVMNSRTDISKLPLSEEQIASFMNSTDLVVEKMMEERQRGSWDLPPIALFELSGTRIDGTRVTWDANFYENTEEMEWVYFNLLKEVS